jgi:hypothetical protein
MLLSLPESIFKPRCNSGRGNASLVAGNGCDGGLHSLVAQARLYLADYDGLRNCPLPPLAMVASMFVSAMIYLYHPFFVALFELVGLFDGLLADYGRADNRDFSLWQLKFLVYSDCGTSRRLLVLCNGEFLPSCPSEEQQG